MPRLLSVQVGQARRVNIHGRAVLTAFHKQAVTGKVPVQPLGLQGDEQADPSVHGGLDKAVYASLPVLAGATRRCGLDRHRRRIALG